MKKQYTLTSDMLKEMVTESVRRILSEKHVIKVPKQEPPMNDMPPMDMQEPPIEEPPMDNMPPMDDQMGDGEEGNSPRQDLQKKSGELSDLIQNGDGIEAEDVKAALNMIIAQAKKKMDGKDLKASADKLTSVDDISDNGEDMEQQELDVPMNQPQQQMSNESRQFLKRKVNEIMNGVLSLDEPYDKRERGNKTITNKKVKRDNPFVYGK